jgi:hypothetical protein
VELVAFEAAAAGGGADRNKRKAGEEGGLTGCRWAVAALPTAFLADVGARAAGVAEVADAAEEGARPPPNCRGAGTARKAAAVPPSCFALASVDAVSPFGRAADAFGRVAAGFEAMWWAASAAWRVADLERRPRSKFPSRSASRSDFSSGLENPPPRERENAPHRDTSASRNPPEVKLARGRRRKLIASPP